MSTLNIAWDPCGSASDAQYLYYGKTLVATGTPITGTGWTLFSGAALGNSVSSESITGLDDNVEYTAYLYCHCATAGNGPLVNQGPFIKYVCPTFASVTSNFNTVNYTMNVPASANNSGTWIQTIVVTLLNSSGSTVLYTNTHTSPFSSSISSSFTGLNPSTTYKIAVAYSNNTSSRTSSCSNQSIVTSASCVAPTVSIANITNSSFDVSFSPITTGDTFDILINGSAVATGLSVSPYTASGLTANTSYQVMVRKNCATGGNATSAATNVTTSALTACASEVTNLISTAVASNAIAITWTNPSNTNGSSVLYRPCGSTTWLTPNAAGNYNGSFDTGIGFSGPNKRYNLTGMVAGTCVEILVQNACGSPSTLSNGLITSVTSTLGQIAGTIGYRCSTNSCAQGHTVLDFTFPTATPAGGLTLLAGFIHTTGSTPLAMGDSLFTLPAGTTEDPTYQTVNGDSKAPIEIDIPAGVTTFTTSAILYQNVKNALNAFNAWECFNQGCISYTVTDIYLNVSNPNGFVANFTSSTGGVTVHNV